MKSQRTRARRESEPSTIDADKRRMRDEFIADWQRWSNVEARLAEWERFFRAAMKPTGRRGDKRGADATEFRRCAQDGLRAAVNARACIEKNNDRGAEIYLLDMAYKTGGLFYLDADRARAARENSLTNLQGTDGGPATRHETRMETDAQILEEFDRIWLENPRPELDAALVRVADALNAIGLNLTDRKIWDVIRGQRGLSKRNKNAKQKR